MRRMLRSLKILGTQTVLEVPSGGFPPPEDGTQATVATADLMLRLSLHTTVKALRIRQCHPADLSNALWAAVSNDLKFGTALHCLFELIQIFNVHRLSPHFGSVRPIRTLINITGRKIEFLDEFVSREIHVQKSFNDRLDMAALIVEHPVD